jgi:hypothetical protein
MTILGRGWAEASELGSIDSAETEVLLPRLYEAGIPLLEDKLEGNAPNLSRPSPLLFPLFWREEEVVEGMFSSSESCMSFPSIWLAELPNDLFQLIPLPADAEGGILACMGLLLLLLLLPPELFLRLGMGGILRLGGTSE